MVTNSNSNNSRNSSNPRNTSASTNTQSQITDIRIYPIKSCRGISVPSATLTTSGLRYDRRWMFVDSQNRFITIREKSEMTLIRTMIDSVAGELVITMGRNNGSNSSNSNNGSSDENNSHSDDESNRVRVPLEPSAAWLAANTERMSVNIWGKETGAYAYTDERMQRIFNEFFNASASASAGNGNGNGNGNEKNASVVAARLVMKDPSVPRVCGGNGDPRVLGRQVTVAFPDVLPVLIVSESSLAELNSRLRLKGQQQQQQKEEREQPQQLQQLEITYERFRPNIIISGGEPWTEDEWKTVRINSALSDLPPPPTLELYSTSTSTSTSNPSSWLSTLSGGYLGSNTNQSQSMRVPSEDGAIDIDIVARCGRCQVPNVDPDTAAKHKREPWDTMMKYRRVDEGLKYKPCFGMLGCPLGEGKVQVGMRFDVLATTKAHKYIMGFS